MKGKAANALDQVDSLEVAADLASDILKIARNLEDELHDFLKRYPTQDYQVGICIWHSVSRGKKNWSKAPKLPWSGQFSVEMWDKNGKECLDVGVENVANCFLSGSAIKALKNEVQLAGFAYKVDLHALAVYWPQAASPSGTIFERPWLQFGEKCLTSLEFQQEDRQYVLTNLKRCFKETMRHFNGAILPRLLFMVHGEDVTTSPGVKRLLRFDEVGKQFRISWKHGSETRDRVMLLSVMVLPAVDAERDQSHPRDFIFQRPHTKYSQPSPEKHTLRKSASRILTNIYQRAGANVRLDNQALVLELWNQLTYPDEDGELEELRTSFGVQYVANIWDQLQGSVPGTTGLSSTNPVYRNFGTNTCHEEESLTVDCINTGGAVEVDFRFGAAIAKTVLIMFWRERETAVWPQTIAEKVGELKTTISEILMPEGTQYTQERRAMIWHPLDVFETGANLAEQARIAFNQEARAVVIVPVEGSRYMASMFHPSKESQLIVQTKSFQYVETHGAPPDEFNYCWDFNLNIIIFPGHLQQ